MDRGDCTRSLAWWDRRVMYVLDMTERDGKLFVPEIDIFVNDLSLPRDAARIASKHLRSWINNWKNIRQGCWKRSLTTISAG